MMTAPNGDYAYTQNERIWLPDVKITKDEPVNTYQPLRGYASCLAVFDADDKCIGWIDTRTLGFENAKDWMKAVNYVTQ